MKEKSKKVLVIGSGGRCHAIVDALSRSSQVEKIYCAPGNAGISEQAECVGIGVTDVDGLLKFAKDNAVDLTVVGPEASLAAGVTDAFVAEGLKIFGPTKAATQIESSKEFAKRLMAKHGIPTAEYQAFEDYESAKAYLETRRIPIVVKYDGLAAGKGVVVAETMQQADEALRDMLLDQSFGKGRVIIEDFLDGPEFSFMCIVSGDKIYPLEMAQDHKRAYEGDKGPNTGGMGAYSPVPFITEEIRNEALIRIMAPTAEAMVKEGVSFCGVLYGGLILTDDGPKVIEFNARFGDPETEVVLPRLKSDIYDLFMAAIEGDDFTAEWSDDAILGIVLASKGYPGSYEKGYPIRGLDGMHFRPYHMGTSVKGGEIVTAGGRVLMVVGRGATLEEAASSALRDVMAVKCDNLFFRKDIGHRVLAPLDQMREE